MLSPFLGLGIFLLLFGVFWIYTKAQCKYQLCDFDSRRCALIFLRDVLMEICLSCPNLMSESLPVLGIVLNSPNSKNQKKNHNTTCLSSLIKLFQKKLLKISNLNCCDRMGDKMDLWGCLEKGVCWATVYVLWLVTDCRKQVTSCLVQEFSLINSCGITIGNAWLST